MEHRLQWREKKLWKGDVCLGDGECAAARELLKRNLAVRQDRIASYRGEMRCLTGGVGWFADHTVKVSTEGTPVFRRFNPVERLKDGQ